LITLQKKLTKQGIVKIFNESVSSKEDEKEDFQNNLANCFAPALKEDSKEALASHTEGIYNLLIKKAKKNPDGIFPENSLNVADLDVTIWDEIKYIFALIINKLFKQNIKSDKSLKDNITQKTKTFATYIQNNKNEECKETERTLGI